MLNPISTASQSQAVAQPATVATPTAQPKGQATAIPQDTVQISAAAKAMQEMTETPAQTAKEAAGGDMQARHLLDREAAARSTE